MKNLIYLLIFLPTMAFSQRVYDLSAIQEPLGPTIFPFGTLISFSTNSGTASPIQSFTFTSVNLTANVVWTAGTGMEVSNDSVTFATTTPAYVQSGGVAAGKVYVRIAAATANGTYSGVISGASTGAVTANVAYSAFVGVTPSIALAPTSISNLNGTIGSLPGTPQTFTVTFANITGNVTLTSFTGVEISQNGTTYGPTQSFSTGSPKTISARVAATASAGGYSGSIAATASGAVTQNLGVTGTVSTGGVTDDTLLINLNDGTTNNAKIFTGGWNNYTPPNLSTGSPSTTSSVFLYKNGTTSPITITLSGDPAVVNSFFTTNNANWGVGTTTGFNDTAFRQTYLFNDPGPDSLIFNVPAATNGYDFHIGSSRSTTTSRNQNIVCKGTTTTSTTFNAQNNINNTIDFVGIQPSGGKIIFIFTPNGQPGGGNDFQFATFIMVRKRN